MSHQTRPSREKDEEGHIVATLHDYARVRDLVDDLISEGIEATVPESVREVVEAAIQLHEEDTSQESLEEIIVGCSGLRQRGVDFKYQPLDEAMEIGESFKRFDRVLAQFQRTGYSNRDILLDATGGTTPLRVGAALAAMMRNVKIVHQRVRRDRYTGGGWHKYTSEDIELLPMGNPLEDTGLLREGQAVNLFNMRDCSAAALVFEDVLEKVVGVERYHYYGGLVRLAKGYGAWDMADYEAALDHLNAARREFS
jgi:CRISPR-associated protein (Cas_Cas02710)